MTSTRLTQTTLLALLTAGALSACSGDASQEGQDAVMPAATTPVGAAGAEEASDNSTGAGAAIAPGAGGVTPGAAAPQAAPPQSPEPQLAIDAMVGPGAPATPAAMGTTATGAIGATGAAGVPAAAATGIAAPTPAPVAPPAEQAIPEAEPIVVDAPSDFPATNPFVSVDFDPLSTFAVDVDTASYDIFRREVERGVLPTPSTVRLEEFVNYFDYDYPEPELDGEHPFTIDLAAAPTLLENGTTLLRVGIQGAPAPELEKKPANLVFLIDTSGSMQSEVKLPLVQRVLTQTLELLEPADTVSIVTYAGSSGVPLAPTPVSNAAAIETVITNLNAGGSTNGAGGIMAAYDQATAAYIEGGINHVILCTDGDFNVGVSSTDGLVELIEEERRTGITFTALGFGTSNNDQMMEAISNAGNGIYGVISSQEQADRYVEERLLDNLTFIAKDMKIQVEFNPEQVLAYRLLGYENRAIADEDFRDDKVDAGEIGAGHRVTALYELVLVDGQVPEVDGAPAMESGDAYDGDVEVDPADLVLVKVRYKDVDASALDEAYETSSSLAPGDIAESHRDLDADFQWAIGVATFAEILKGSPYASDGSLGSISVIVDEQAQRDQDRSEFKTLFDAATGMLGGSTR